MCLNTFDGKSNKIWGRDTKSHPVRKNLKVSAARKMQDGKPVCIGTHVIHGHIGALLEIFIYKKVEMTVR